MPGSTLESDEAIMAWMKALRHREVSAQWCCGSQALKWMKLVTSDVEASANAYRAHFTSGQRQRQRQPARACSATAVLTAFGNCEPGRQARTAAGDFTSSTSVARCCESCPLLEHRQRERPPPVAATVKVHANTTRRVACVPLPLCTPA